MVVAGFPIRSLDVVTNSYRPNGSAMHVRRVRFRPLLHADRSLNKVKIAAGCALNGDGKRPGQNLDERSRG
jgi:hypothetical protein